MTENPLLEALKQAATKPEPLPKGVTPGIIYSGEKPTRITTPWLDEECKTQEDFRKVCVDMGVPLEDHQRLELVKARFNQAAWHRDNQDIGEKFTAYTKPMWLYEFKVVGRALALDVDLKAMMAEAKRASKSMTVKKLNGVTSMIIDMADFQVGKTDILGGTKELLERAEVALAKVLKQVRKIKPDEIVLVDGGDSTEGFESSPNAARTNDLQQTEQIRVWRRLFWRWITALAKVVAKLEVVAVPSNHCQVRQGKNRVGTTLDDWGIEVLSQVADMAAVNPDAFGHVTFHQPREFEEYVVLTLLGGKTVGFVHGHQGNNPQGMVEWCRKQGRRPIGQVDVLFFHHFHHLELIIFGDNQTGFCSPTMDPGSSWHTNGSGNSSAPGVLTLAFDEDGWRDMFIAWA